MASQVGEKYYKMYFWFGLKAMLFYVVRQNCKTALLTLSTKSWVISNFILDNKFLIMNIFKEFVNMSDTLNHLSC